MQSMMNHSMGMSRRSRWARGIAAAAIAASGVAAACMIQVQPTFAAQQADAQPQQSQLQVIVEDHAPALASGRSAEQHLRDANRRLREAKSAATSDDDRSKIATAQQMLRMAQAELAKQSDPQPMTVQVVSQAKLDDLHALDVQLKQLDQQAFQLKLDTQQHMRIQMIQADQQKKMQALQKQLNSPERQLRLQKQAMDQIRVQVNAQMQDRVKEAQRLAKDSVMIAKLEPPVMKVEPPVILVEAQEAPKVVRISSNLMAGQLVNKTQPVYPQAAKDAKISGSVVLHAIIDETGKVESLAIVSSPDKDLSRSAIDAVQHWTYRPYMLNGKATSVDTTITVNYTFGG